MMLLLIILIIANLNTHKVEFEIDEHVSPNLWQTRIPLPSFVKVCERFNVSVQLL